VQHVASQFYLDKFKSTSQLGKYMFINNRDKETTEQKEPLYNGSRNTREIHKRLHICFLMVLEFEVKDLSLLCRGLTMPPALEFLLFFLCHLYCF
jgi:hypothetical protein